MNRVLRAYRSTVGVGLALTLWACASNQFGSPCPIPDKATDEQKLAAVNGCVPGINEDHFDAHERKEVDILFAIDNSTSMSPKQAALAANIQTFITEINKFEADLHIGVVTSDIGSWASEGAAWSMPIQGCNSFKGDDGLLQVKGCGQRFSQNTSEAQNACASLCTNPQFLNAATVTTDGSRFISKVAGRTNVVGDNVTEAFKCMALVGDGGCGIEAQLESVKRALDGHLADNTKFLSNGAILAVIFITDEDDCSVRLDRRSENSPTSRDCSTADQNASFDCYNPDFRCLARSVQCTEPMNTTGTKTNCKERANNYLETTKKYHDFLSTLAGDDQHLLISGIWTQKSIDQGGQVVINYQGMGSASANLNRAPGISASCAYSGNNAIFGQAQRRLSEFASSFGTYVDEKQMTQPRVPEFSVCNIDGYAQALDAIREAIRKRLAAFCLPRVPKVIAGVPNCLVGDVDVENPNSTPDKLLPVCSATCCNGWATSTNPTPSDPTVVAACSSEPNECYCAVKSTGGACTMGVGWTGGVWRKGVEPPVGKIINFRCANGP